MPTIDFYELLNEIRVNLMSYLWSDTGDELEASHYLQEIFDTLDSAVKAYDKLQTDLIVEKNDNIRLHKKLLELENKIRDLKTSE